MPKIGRVRFDTSWPENVVGRDPIILSIGFRLESDRKESGLNLIGVGLKLVESWHHVQISARQKLQITIKIRGNMIQISNRLMRQNW